MPTTFFQIGQTTTVSGQSVLIISIDYTFSQKAVVWVAGATSPTVVSIENLGS
jgi:hypothetical protein